jgi:hypothetical protein
MKSIKFPEVTHAIAEDQPEYETLYSHVSIKEDISTVTACFQLSTEELEQINETGVIWYQQLKNTISPLQPLIILTTKPQL